MSLIIVITDFLIFCWADKIKHRYPRKVLVNNLGGGVLSLGQKATLRVYHPNHWNSTEISCSIYLCMSAEIEQLFPERYCDQPFAPYSLNAGHISHLYGDWYLLPNRVSPWSSVVVFVPVTLCNAAFSLLCALARESFKLSLSLFGVLNWWVW